MSKIAKSKKSKQIVSVLLCFALLLSYLQTAVFAGEVVNYRYCDYNGANWQTESVTDYILVTADDTTWGSSGTWYVAKGDITINSRVTVNGTVNLILSDYSKLTIDGGISVNEGKSLTIYAQSTGDNMGELIATARDKFAGIGGDSGIDCGSVTINGGNISATSVNRGAGIGGGLNASGGDITINSGVITATVLSGESAAIGGGASNATIHPSAGNIKIRGGIITATCLTEDYCSIGPGGNGSEGIIEITGGVIIANGEIGHTSTSFETTVSGDVILTCNKFFSGKNDGENLNGLIIVNGTGTVYGDVTLPEDWKFNEGETITIPNGSSLTVPEDIILTNDGTIIVENGGELIKTYELPGKGKIVAPLSGELSISDNVVNGETVTAEYKPGIEEEKYTYQWFRVDEDNNETPISEAIKDKDKYELTTADVGYRIKVEVKGIDNFTDSIEKYTGVIQRAQFAPGEITYSGCDEIYDGSSHSITVIPPDDAKVEYSTTSDGPYSSKNPEYVDVGDYPVYFHVTNDGYEYYGEELVKISKANLKKLTVELSENEFDYNGTLQKPKITIKSGDKTIASSNYGVEWPVDSVTPGEKEVIITAKGNNCEGQVNVSYKINKAVLEASNFSFSAAGGTYDGTVKTANVTLRPELERAGDINVKYYNEVGYKLEGAPIDAGTYTVKIAVTEGEYFDATIDDLTDPSWKFTISPRNITVKADDIIKDYDGRPVTDFTCQITNGSLATGESLNGNLACENDGNVGTYSITRGTLTNEYNPNYNITFIPGTLTIGKANPDIGTVTAYFVVNPDNVINTGDIVLKRSNTSVKGKLTVDPDQTLKFGDNQIHWTFTPDDSKSYNTISGTASVDVSDTVGPMGTVWLGTNSWNELLNGITFGIFYKETQTVSVSDVKDICFEHNAIDTCPEVKIEYYESTTEMNLNTLNALPDSMWEDMSGTGVDVTPEDAKQFVYYIRMTDTVGNKSYISTNGVEFDTTAPQITGITAGATYYTTQKAVIVEKNPESATLNGFELNGSEKTVIIDGNRDTTYTVTATDKVQLSSSVTIYMKSISSLSTDIDSINDSNVTADNKETINAVKSNLENVLEYDSKNATDSEKDELEAKINNANQLLDKIDTVEQKISDIEDVVDDYLPDNVKSSAKDILEQTKKDIEDLTDSDNLTSEQRDKLETLDSTIQELLDKIEEVTSENARITDEFKSYNIDSVKSTDEDAIKKLLNDINKQLSSNNLTDDEIETLNVQKSGCEDFLNRIKSVRDTMASIKDSIDKYEAYDPDNLTMADKEIILELIENIDELVSGDNTTEEEKDNMSSLKDDAKALIKIIDEAELLRIKEALDGYELETVKTTDESDIQLLLEAIKSLLDTVDSQLDPDELNELKDFCESLLVRIKDVNDKLDDISERIGNYSEDTIKSSDKDSLTELVNEITEFSTSTNLLETEKDTLSSQKTNAEDLLEKIDELLNKLDELSKKADMYDLTTVKATDKEDVSLIAEDVNAQLNTSNYTDDEISKLNGLKTFFDNILSRLKGISDLITNLSEQIAKYSADTVKATDKGALEQIITSADELLSSDNLVEDQRKTLEDIKKTAEGLLEVIKRVADSLTTENTEKVKDITAENVKPEDREDLEKAKSDFEDALKNNVNNYTDEQKKEIQDNLDRINGALDALDKVKAVEKLIEELPDVVELEDAEQVDAAKAAYDALTDHEKSLISDELKAKLENAVAKLEALRKALEANSNNDSDNNRHNSGGDSDSPDTGDKSTPVVWAILFIISGLYLGVMIYGVKRKKKN